MKAKRSHLKILYLTSPYVHYALVASFSKLPRFVIIDGTMKKDGWFPLSELVEHPTTQQNLPIVGRRYHRDRLVRVPALQDGGIVTVVKKSRDSVKTSIQIFKLLLTYN